MTKIFKNSIHSQDTICIFKLFTWLAVVLDFAFPECVPGIWDATKNGWIYKDMWQVNVRRHYRLTCQTVRLFSSINRARIWLFSSLLIIITLSKMIQMTTGVPSQWRQSSSSGKQEQQYRNRQSHKNLPNIVFPGKLLLIKSEIIATSHAETLIL